MSTIASPRQPSIRSPTPSSGRPSFDNTRTNSPSRGSGHTPINRRNRAALRDYYNLKSAGPVDASSGQQHEDAESVTSPLGVTATTASPSELDNANLDAPAYVQNLLEHSSLQQILQVEIDLIGDIRGLDGEKKALVYDNYSKLIAATDTIRKMRKEMEPLTPTTRTLGPAVGDIVETSKRLAEGMEKGNSSLGRGSEAVVKKRQKDTVRWVMNAPQRLMRLVKNGEVERARKDWAEVHRLLEKWQGVDGVSEVERQCEQIFADHT